MKQIFYGLNFKAFMVLFSILGFIFICKERSYSQIPNGKNKYPHPRVISFQPDSNQYQNLLNGEKDSVIFCSGVVTLEPNKSGEVHSTKIYEEIIIPLQGEGRVKLNDTIKLDIHYGKIAFIPPYTEHQIVNTGKKIFKYIYIVAKSK